MRREKQEAQLQSHCSQEVAQQEALLQTLHS